MSEPRRTRGVSIHWVSRIPAKATIVQSRNVHRTFRGWVSENRAICKTPLGIVSAMTLFERSLTYPEVGATARQMPDGYSHLAVHWVIGHGESTFRRAAERLMSWQMHRAAGLIVEAPHPASSRAVVFACARAGTCSGSLWVPSDLCRRGTAPARLRLRNPARPPRAGRGKVLRRVAGG